jgi:hypothetical protein
MSDTTDIDDTIIEPDVEETPEQTERPLTARERIMQAAVRGAQERREAELAQSSVYDTDAKALGLVYETDEPEEAAPEPAEPEPVAKSPEPPVPAAVAPAAAPRATLPEPTGVRSVMVDGRQFEVTDQQYAELARLGMLANVALHQYQQQPASAPVAPAAPEPARSLVDPEAVKRVVREIQFGGEDAAAAALADYTTSLLQNIPAPAPQIDQNAIVQQAVAAARAQALLDQHRAVIQQEYADIFANPQRQFLAQSNVEAIRRRNTQLGNRQSDLEVFREAGNMVRDAMGIPPPQPQQQEVQAEQPVAPVVARTEVIERKRAAPRPTQTIDRREPAPQAPRAPTVSEIVAKMREQRGFAPAR